MWQHFLSTGAVVALIVSATAAEAIAPTIIDSGTGQPLENPDDLAFPSARGFAAHALGGRGGGIHEVTTLADDGPGSLRECIEASGPRTCVFATGGTIELDDVLVVSDPYLTIAGQTAPGDGIQLMLSETDTQQVLKITTHDVVIRHVRLRRGATSLSAAPGGTCCGDTVVLISAERVIFDHVTVGFGTDENFSVVDSVDVTLQDSIISYGLRYSTNADTVDDPNQHHSMGVMVSDGASGVSLIRNLLAFNLNRNPRLQSGLTEVCGNLVYGATAHPILMSGDARANVVGNHFDPEPENDYDYVIRTNNSSQAYADGNTTPADMFRSGSNEASSPYQTPSCDDEPSRDDILSEVGAWPRDSLDDATIGHVENGTGALIDDPSEVGGWPQLATGDPATDDDGDGMADQWEVEVGLDPDDGEDRNDDYFEAGYTALEVYLAWLAHDVEIETAASPAPVLALTVTPASISAGDTASLSWSATSADACEASGGWSGAKPTDGTESVSPPDNATYTLTCTGPGGSVTETVSLAVEDVPAPSLVFSVQDDTITAGESTELSWSSANADACEASGDWSGARPTDGTESVSPSADATYVLTCTGEGGEVMADVSVAVTEPEPVPAAELTLAASPSTVTEGESSTLSWSATDADSCTAGGTWSGEQPTSGSATVSPAVTSSYSLTCIGAGGSDTEEVVVTVEPSEDPSVADGLVLHYSFDDGRATDLSGHGNHGVISGADESSGKIGRALEFDGNDFVRVPNSPSLRTSPHVTFAAWVTYDDDRHGLVYRLGGSDGRGGSQRNNSILIDNDDLVAQVWSGEIDADEELDSDEWYHIAYVFDGRRHYLYVDGDLVERESESQRSFPTGSDDVFLGIGRSSGYFLVGKLDDVRIYNAALSADEVADLYRSGQLLASAQ